MNNINDIQLKRSIEIVGLNWENLNLSPKLGIDHL